MSKVQLHNALLNGKISIQEYYLIILGLEKESKNNNYVDSFAIGLTPKVNKRNF